MATFVVGARADRVIWCRHIGCHVYLLLRLSRVLYSPNIFLLPPPPSSSSATATPTATARLVTRLTALALTLLVFKLLLSIGTIAAAAAL